MEGTKLSEDVTVTGQVTPEQLRQAAKEGFHSVLNLRAPEEQGVLADEKVVAENVVLSYINIPVRKMEISDALATQVLAEIDNLPKPVLIHCASGMRAGAMAFMHMATRHGMSAEDALAKAEAGGAIATASRN